MAPTLQKLRWPLAAFGLIAGIFTTWVQVSLTDFPVDMIIYREGVKAFIEGRSLYSEPMMAGDIALPFIYPPFGALAMVSLTAPQWLSDDGAGNIMIVLSNMLVLACLYFVLRAVTGKKNIWWAVLPVWALALNFEPIRLNNGFSQINIVIMALVVFDLVPRKRWLPQGTLIGLAAAIKVTPLAMLLYFALRKEVKPILTALVSAAVATLLAAAYRWNAFLEFFTSKLVDMGSGKDFGVATDYQSNSSIKALIQRAYSSHEAMTEHTTLTNLVWLLCALLVIGAGAVIMRYLFSRSMVTEAWMINAIIMLLISPVSWSHHWVWLSLIVPVFIFHAWRWRTWFGGGFFAVMIAWLAMILTVPPKWWFGDSIDVQALRFYQKFVINDFIWLSFIAIALFVACVKETQLGTKEKSQATRS